ncbi:MAG: Wzz/FepE/Etk N-terminal domain-containing protein [Desulfosalsimonadaceae bacterium]
MTEDGKFGKETGRSTQGDSARTGGIAPGGQYQVTQPPPPGWYPPAEDEIDLADLVGVLYRRKWLIAGVTILFACLAFAATFSRAEIYRATSIIEVGQVQEVVAPPENPESMVFETKYIEEPGAAAERLRAMATLVYRDPPFNAEARFSIPNSLSISPSKGGGMVHVDLEAPKDSRAITFLTELNGRLIQAHERTLKAKRRGLEARIQNLQNSIDEFRNQKTAYKKQLKSLREEEQFLKEQLQSVKQQMNTRDTAMSGKETIKQTDSSADAQQLQDAKSLLNTRLLSEIPAKQERLFEKIRKFESEIRSLQNELEMTRVRLNNFENTKVFLAPSFSKKPVSSGPKLIVALGLVLGLFLSVFLAFIIEFWQHNKERIKGGQETAGEQSQG